MEWKTVDGVYKEHQGKANLQFPDEATSVVDSACASGSRAEIGPPVENAGDCECEYCDRRTIQEPS